MPEPDNYGIKLFRSSPSLGVDKCLHISSGLRLASPIATEDGGAPFASPAFIPTPEWRAAPLQWWPMREFSPATGIALIRIPNWGALRTAALGGDKTTIDRAAEAVLGQVSEWCGLRDVVFSGVTSHRQDLATVTVDTKTSQRIGLHIDSWDRLPNSRRHLATNRVCINLGPEPRHFLFLGVTVQGMRSRLALAGIPLAAPDDSKSVLDAFFHRYPDEPVWRLTLRKGEGYIAPTENVVHDASTVGSSDPVYCATWRGRIGLLPIRRG